MKKDNIEKEDKLRPEYNLKGLKVRKVGAGRRGFNEQKVRDRKTPRLNSGPTE